MSLVLFSLMYHNQYYLQKNSPHISHKNMISNSSNNHIWKLKTIYLLKNSLQLSQVFSDSEKIFNQSIYLILYKIQDILYQFHFSHTYTFNNPYNLRTENTNFLYPSFFFQVKKFSLVQNVMKVTALAASNKTIKMKNEESYNFSFFFQVKKSRLVQNVKKVAALAASNTYTNKMNTARPVITIF